jgi:hypothetical protein
MLKIYLRVREQQSCIPLLQTIGQEMAVRVPALLAGRPVPPGTLFQANGATGRIRGADKSNDLTGNSTRDLPASSAVSQPTTRSRALEVWQTVTTLRKDHHGGRYGSRRRSMVASDKQLHRSIFCQVTNTSHAVFT